MDTGSTNTVMLHLLSRKLWALSELQPCPSKFLTSSGEASTPLGVRPGCIRTLGPVSLPVDVQVTRASIYSLLIGIDYLSMAGAFINLAARTLTVKVDTDSFASVPIIVQRQLHRTIMTFMAAPLQPESPGNGGTTDVQEHATADRVRDQAEAALAASSIQVAAGLGPTAASGAHGTTIRCSHRTAPVVLSCSLVGAGSGETQPANVAENGPPLMGRDSPFIRSPGLPSGQLGHKLTLKPLPGIPIACSTQQAVAITHPGMPVPHSPFIPASLLHGLMPGTLAWSVTWSWRPVPRLLYWRILGPVGRLCCRTAGPQRGMLCPWRHLWTLAGYICGLGRRPETHAYMPLSDVKRQM